MWAGWGSRACTESPGSCHFTLPSNICSVLAVFLMLKKPSIAPGQLLAGKRAGESAFTTHELVQRLIPIWLVLSWGGFCHFICNCFAVEHLEGFTRPGCFTKDIVLITAVNELLCISVNGKENLSPQDKKGVEVSDDPLRRLRQSTKLKSSSCISLSLGAIGIISPFSRTSRSPCPLPNSILASLQAAGKSCQSPVLCWGPAEDAWCLLGVRTAVPGASETPIHAWNPAQGVPWSMPSSPGEAGASWCPSTPPPTAGPKDLIDPCAKRCAFPFGIAALQKGPSGI